MKSILILLGILTLCQVASSLILPIFEPVSVAHTLSKILHFLSGGRSPLALGYKYYRHLDYGEDDPRGEFRQQYSFRIGPKPIPYWSESDWSTAREIRYGDWVPQEDTNW